MNEQRLEQLGFTVSGSGDEAEISAELLSPLLNPLTREFIDRVEFRMHKGRLVPTAPPALAGLPPQPLVGMEKLSDFESQLRAEFDRAVMQLQRRSAELQALGLQPEVDPNTLEVRAEITTPSLWVRVAADKQGNFLVKEARRGETTLELPANIRFDVSEFREGQALIAYLETLVMELSGQVEVQSEPAPPAPRQAPAPQAKSPAAPDQSAVVRPLSLGDLTDRFGARAVVPQKTPVEIVADLRVGEDRYRFAASRVLGRTFRGLLAGPRGKVWADRFELDEFPGVVELVARELEISKDEVILVGLDLHGAR